MSFRCASLLTALALFAFPVTSSTAADFGTVSGAVVDSSGQPVAGAAVTISGDPLPVGRATETDSNGIYQFQYLAAGEYRVVISKGGAGPVTRTAFVDIGKDTQVDVILGTSLTEELTVTAAVSGVDVRSTEVGFNFSAAELNALPLERTYRGLFQLIPGVADNRNATGPAAGGSKQENLYLIDGANITNPNFGTLSTEVNELDIAEVNLKRAGISAEFGRTSGSVVNAVSRSGSNVWTGIGRVDWLAERLVAAYKLPDALLDAGIKPGTFRDPLLTAQAVPAAGVGGPLIESHLFFYGSARYYRETKWGRVNRVSTPLPDEVRRGSELYGKVTAGPTASHELALSYRYRPNHTDNAGLTSDFAPSVATRTDNGSAVGTAEWAGFLGRSRSVQARYFYLSADNEDVPVTTLGYLPPFDPRNLAAMGQYMDPAQANLTIGGNQFTAIQDYRRHEVRGTFTQLLDLGKSSHAIKAGAGYEIGEETYNRLANGWGAIVDVTQNGVPTLRARYFTPQAPQLGQGRTHAIFVQDDVRILNRLSLNVGVLLNRDEFSQKLEGRGRCPSTILLKGGAAVYESDGDSCRFLRFGFGSEIQPRLGAAYQLRPGAGDKAYANWGRYYNMDQKSSARSLAPNRVFQTQTFFDLNGTMLSSGPLASTTGKWIDPDIQPIYSDEVLAGYATPIGGSQSIDVFFLSRSMHNIIEDLPSRLNGSAPTDGPFVAANLPCQRFGACANADARRTYRAVTADFQRRMSGSWMGGLSYTWSRFEGNYDLDYSSTAVFNTSSFIQDGPGGNVEDPNRFGPLVEDRPHVFKLYGSYAATPPFMLSGYLRVQSGAPWTARGRDWAGGGLNYLEPAGSHRNPVWSNLDLMGSYRLPLTGRTNVTLEVRLLNVFDNQAQLSTDSLQYLDLRMLSTAPFIGPYVQPNPFFGTGNAFAPPRRLYLAATVSFDAR